MGWIRGGFGGVQFGGTLIGSGDPWLAFNNGVWHDLGEGAAATADGVVPFFDPLASNGVYDANDPVLRWSRTAGALGRDALLAAGLAAWTAAKAAPNAWQLWNSSPANAIRYELGSVSLPKSVYLEMLAKLGEGANAIQKYRWLREQGQLWKNLVNLRFIPNVPSGPTPGGAIAVTFVLIFDAATQILARIPMTKKPQRRPTSSHPILAPGSRFRHPQSTLHTRVHFGTGGSLWPTGPAGSSFGDNCRD